MTPKKQAEIAIQAARLRRYKHVGRFASRRYAELKGVNFALVRLCIQLEAMQRIDNQLERA